MQRSKTVRQGLFAAAVTLALGFGAREVLAAPAPNAGGTTCTATWAAKCNDICQGYGYDYGICDSSSVGTYGTCHCKFYPAD